MNETIFRQYDTRWGSLPYKNRSNVSGSGCGLLSITHCCIERKCYRECTPKDFHAYMRQFAVDGQGTLHSGIRDALIHYGFENVKWFGEADPMSEVFAELNKGGRIGVILFDNSYAPDGTHFTSSGHYIAFTGYKVQNKKHYFYLKDSGTRKHDGWFCYETKMKNCVSQVWTCTIPTEKTYKYNGTLPNLEVTYKNNDKCLSKVCAYAHKIANNNKYKYKKWTSDPKTHMCAVCHPDSGLGWNCIGFVGACLHHGGGIDVSCRCDGLGNNAFFDHLTLAKWKDRNGKNWSEVSTPSAGDVILCYSKSTGKYIHTALYVGGGLIADATSSLGISVRAYTKLSKYKKRIFHYTGQQKTYKKTKALKKGDTRKTQVKRLQSFLKWYGCDIKVDGIYGQKTVNAVRKFKTENKLKNKNGAIFGTAALNKAKAVKR